MSVMISAYRGNPGRLKSRGRSLDNPVPACDWSTEGAGTAGRDPQPPRPLTKIALTLDVVDEVGGAMKAADGGRALLFEAAASRGSATVRMERGASAVLVACTY